MNSDYLPTQHEVLSQCKYLIHNRLRSRTVSARSVNRPYSGGRFDERRAACACAVNRQARHGYFFDYVTRAIEKPNPGCEDFLVYP